MWNRREFSVGMSAVAAAALPGKAGAGRIWPKTMGPGDVVIFEPGVEISRAYARMLEQQGATGCSAEQDIGRLWHADLRARIENGAMVNGVTRYAVQFLMTVLARDSGFQFDAVTPWGKAPNTPARDMEGALYSWSVRARSKGDDRRMS